MIKTVKNNELTVAEPATQAVSIYDKIEVESATGAIEKMGSWFARSGMYGCEKIEQGIMLALHCVSQRKDPLDLLRSYNLIGGRLAMKADAMLAEFRQRGGKVRWVRFDAEAAEAEFEFEGQKVKLAFTIEDARRAELVKPRSGWVKHPAAMLRARLVSMAVRMLCPEVNCGAYTPEEVRDFTAPPASLPAGGRAPKPLFSAQPDGAAPEPESGGEKSAAQARPPGGPGTPRPPRGAKVQAAPPTPPAGSQPRTATSPSVNKES